MAVDADQVAGEQHPLGGKPDDRVAGGVGRAELDRDGYPRSRSPVKVSVGGVSSRVGTSAAIRRARSFRLVVLELGQVGLHLLLHPGHPSGADLADRLRGLLGGEDREVGERLRAAVVVEVGVRDEQALDATDVGAKLAAGRGHEAAVDRERAGDPGVADRRRRCRARRPPSSSASAARSGSSERLLQRPHITLERRRAFLGDLDRARADDDSVDELGGGAGVLGRRDPEAGVERLLGGAARALDEAGERGGEVAARAGRPGQRDEVEPAVGLLGGERDPLVGRGRRDELDAAQLGPVAGGEVGDDQALGARWPVRPPRTGPSRTPRGSRSRSSARAAPARGRASRPGTRGRRASASRRQAPSRRRGGSPGRRRADRRTGSRSRRGRRRPPPPRRRGRACRRRPSGR